MGGNKKDEGVLKAFITATDRIIERKGIDLYVVKNLTRLVVASNESWAVPVGIDDRRFVFCDVSDRRKKDSEFFAKLYTQMMQEGGLEALMHDLTNEDLLGWLPHERPKNNDLRSTDLKIMSMGSVQRFVFGWLDTGGLMRYAERVDKSGFGIGSYRYKVVFSLFYIEYQDWVNENKLNRVETNNMFSRIVFGTEDTKRGLNKQGLLPYEYSKNTTVNGRKGKVYELPDIYECRGWFEDHVAHGRLEWTSDAEEWDPRRCAIEELTDNVFQPLKWGTKS